MLPQEILVNRELSWLEFNRRVLHEAMRHDVPLFERLMFAGIYFSNMDEFFMVRVGSLTDQSLMDPKRLDDKTGWNAARQVEEILKGVRADVPKTEKMYHALCKELRAQSVDLVDFSKISKMEEMLAEKYFKESIMPLLSPQIVDHHHPFPFLNNKEQYVAVVLAGKQGKNGEKGEKSEKAQKREEIKLGIIPVGQLPPYFVVGLDNRKKVMFTSDIVCHFAQQVFGKSKIEERATIRITRNADISVDEALLDYEMDFRGAMQEALKKRRRLFGVRLQILGKVSSHLEKYLCRYLEIHPNSVFMQSIPLDFGFGFSLPSALKLENAAQLQFPERKPMTPSRFKRKIPIREMAKDEVLLAYPFHSSRPFLDMLYEAADDPEVVSIKISLYRLAKHSKVVSALCRAAENGKHVLCVLELRARFDEQSNIDYASILEQAGCTIIYGLSDYKIHAKLCLITRKDQNGKISYTSQIGTGNYNEKTMEQYTDLCFITNDEAVGRDATAVFNCLAVGETVEQTESLWVAPNCFRSRVISLIDREISIQKSGGKGYINIKVNSMNDMGIMEKLVEASQAGVEIKMHIRGICCLRPGVEGYTENIQIDAILGRHLEHSRIYVFGQGDRQRIFMGSGDLLNRNTRRRVEIFAEPKSEAVRQELLYIIEMQEKDNQQCWLMQPDGTYHKKNPEEGELKISSQDVLAEHFMKDDPVEPIVQPDPAPKKRGLLARLFGFGNRFEG
ncbi:MAG: polyphosphate kinase 1 [Butyricicoccaceae bacterium]